MGGFRLATTVFVAIAASGVANASDFIRVTFNQYCSVPCSLETSEIYVSRSPGPGWTVAEIDTLFASIRQTLEAANMPIAWDTVPGIHSDRIKVEIRLDEKRYAFSTDYGSTGIPAMVNEPSEERRRRLALQDILQLTADYSVKRYELLKGE